MFFCITNTIVAILILASSAFGGIPPPPVYACNQVIPYRVVFEFDYQYYQSRGSVACMSFVQQSLAYMRPIYLRDFALDIVNAGVVINTTNNDGYGMPPTTTGFLTEMIAKWSNTALYNQYRPGSVVLISGRVTNTSLGGFSFLGGACGPGVCVVNGIATNDSLILGRVTAHELAHTLGAGHDDSCSPAYIGYLMDTTANGVVLEAFSPCSIESVTNNRRTWTCVQNYSCCESSRTLEGLFDFLNSYFSGNGDFNNDGNVGVQDIFDFLNCYFSN